MTGYQSKKAMAQDKLNDDDDTQVYKDHGDVLTAAYMSGYYDGKKAAQPEQEPVALGLEWVPCVKLPVVVHVRNQRKGECHVSTREGITPVKPDDFIMRGVAGEEYPIGRELWYQTYTTNIIPDKVLAKQEPVTWAGVDFDINTTPPQRTWVGLTDEEIYNLKGFYDYMTKDEFFEAVRGVEAILKGKNK